jgi:glycerophosphoryl diester phosphodiesterase
MTYPLPEIPGKKKPYIIAHRGNQVLCPENTIAAFLQALEDGADIIETDLQLSSDGVFMCIHDPTVDRTTDSTGPVSQMTTAELKSLSAFYGMEGFEEERIPTLSEFASIIPDDTLIALELKGDDFLDSRVCRQLVSELDRMGIRDRTIVLSFSILRVQTVRSIAPDMLAGWITLFSAWPPVDIQLLGPKWQLLIINPLYVWIAHRRRQMVCPLDQFPDSRLGLYRFLGCDAVLTNDPGATRRALNEIDKNG